jgi:hypothetical protein
MEPSQPATQNMGQELNHLEAIFVQGHVSPDAASTASMKQCRKSHQLI